MLTGRHLKGSEIFEWRSKLSQRHARGSHTRLPFEEEVEENVLKRYVGSRNTRSACWIKFALTDLGIKIKDVLAPGSTFESTKNNEAPTTPFS
jgi:hypothetical protein